jgi:hypothetical protein
MERIEFLRRRITLYRCYLREGCSAPQALLYLRQIQQDEAELAAIASEGHDDERGTTRRAPSRAGAASPLIGRRGERPQPGKTP